ncbi:MAG: hypothetical protein Ct9H90mP30_1680 [Actinomycetota bacterium]|nr:MAG: hypothetical protein Ct9H90mP30_1680 [Actinomycetota bacterium]
MNQGRKKTDGNPGPNTTILGTRLDPYTLGQLVALYEHKVFTMGAIWQINSFDQDGVQIGKSLAASIENDLSLAEDFQTMTPLRNHFYPFTSNGEGYSLKEMRMMLFLNYLRNCFFSYF